MPPKKGGKTGNQRATTGYLRNKLQSGSPGSLAKKMDLLMSRIPKGTFASVGGAMGGPAGAMAGRGLSAITGYGDYTVKANSLSNATLIGEMADQVPVFKQQGADVRVKHCEFVRDVTVPATGKEAFAVQTFNIDPTDASTFPWLASVAAKYQRYKVKGMVVGYRSTSTDYNNSGVIAIAVNYDPAERHFDSMSDMLNSKFAVSTKPSNSMLAPIECDPSRSPMDGYYVKHTTSADMTDASMRQTIMGKINVATSGLTLDPNATIGQLYVSYDIEFMYPYMHVESAAVTGDFGAFTGLAAHIDQNSLTADINTYAVGKLKGYDATTDAGGKVQVKWLGSPITSTTAWYQLVMPVGTYTISVSDGGFDSYQRVTSRQDDGARFGSNVAGRLIAGGPTNLAATFGSAITHVVMHEARPSGGSGNSEGSINQAAYTLTVTAGTEAERSFSPYMQAGRNATPSGPGRLGLNIAFTRA